MSIAEDMTTGVACESCGQYFTDDDAEEMAEMGIPQYCDEQCAEDRGADWWVEWKEDCEIIKTIPEAKLNAMDMDELDRYITKIKKNQ